MGESERLEAEVRGLLLGLATEAPAVPPVPRKMVRRANLRRARTLVVFGLTAALLGYGAFRGAQALRVLPQPAVRPTTPIQTGIPEAARLDHIYGLQPDLMTAGGGRLYGLVLRSGSGATVFRIDRDGGITRRVLPDPLAPYFSQLIDQGQTLYVGTSVINRFTGASDELLRLDASALIVTARTTLPGGVVALASDRQNVWVALADRVLRMDPVSLAVRASHIVSEDLPSTGSISSLGLGPGGLWATFGDARHTEVYRFDPVSLAVLSQVGVSESGQGIRVAAGPESVWLTGQDFVRRIDPSGHLAGPALEAGLQMAAAQGHGLVAVFSTGDVVETLVQFGAEGGVIARSKVGDAGGQLAVDGRDVWLLHGLSLAHWTLLNPVP